MESHASSRPHTLKMDILVMATDRQIEANRLNAGRSTGPKTVEGKLRSRANSMIHGMAGAVGFVENGRTAAFDDRRSQWADGYQPQDAAGEFTLDRLVAASLRIEQCERAIDDATARHSLRAQCAWEQDQSLEVAVLASRLAKDPLLVSRQLEAGRHGCQLMIELWDLLGATIAIKGVWTESETSKALDLLGIATEHRSGLTPLDPSPGKAEAEHLETLCDDAIQRLRSLIEALTPVDAMARRQAEAGDIALLTKPVLLILRYERDAWRRFNQATRELRNATKAADEAVETLPPAIKPALKPAAPSKPEIGSDAYFKALGDQMLQQMLDRDARRVKESDELHAKDSASFSSVDLSATPAISPTSERSATPTTPAMR